MLIYLSVSVRHSLRFHEINIHLLLMALMYSTCYATKIAMLHLPARVHETDTWRTHEDTWIRNAEMNANTD